mmetsp:Transcript_22124/g.61884  ORF Transcript_22124/g.61884 Transcript_22124/m.61884 type:complete len:83 (-) Transcript_22124:547-795(-)
MRRQPQTGRVAVVPPVNFQAYSEVRAVGTTTTHRHVTQPCLPPFPAMRACACQRAAPEEQQLFCCGPTRSWRDHFLDGHALD